jgi:CheY-like chemotaxis protein/HPt (histidine-containing phosphotransfer) domain-containing protein
LPQPLPIQSVLVLDDDEVMRDLLEALLSLEGCQVTTASTGEEALTALQAHRAFDLVLTDLHMPGLEGEELVTALRRAISRKALLLGTSANEPSTEILAQLDAFLPKPFDALQLQEAIEAAAQGHASGRRAATTANPTAHDNPGPHAAPLDDTIFQSLLKIIPRAQLGKLYEMTLGDIEKRYARMQAAAAADDLTDLKREAHAVKGSCGMVGATELQSLATTIEGGTTLNTSALAEIPAACDRLRRMLDDKLQTV